MLLDSFLHTTSFSDANIVGVSRSRLDFINTWFIVREFASASLVELDGFLGHIRPLSASRAFVVFLIEQQGLFGNFHSSQAMEAVPNSSFAGSHCAALFCFAT